MSTQPYKKILAIESSCDDTAVAIVEHGRRVLGSVIYSQDSAHSQYGGIVPEAAARLHIQGINGALQQVFDRCDMTIDSIDAFATTLGPGLVGSLLVGANTAKTLSFITDKPFVGVNHLRAHVASNYLESDLEPPFICLLVSGGHTQLILVKGYTDMVLLGQTRDDAVGEAYDKVARLMGLGYPGGPAVDRLSVKGDARSFTLPRARLSDPFDFSFSGLKTAVARAFQKAEELLPADRETEENGSRQVALKELQANMAASFQYTVVETLFKKTVQCAEFYQISTIAVAGGVSANQALRKRFQDFGIQSEGRYHIHLPKAGYCTDNAAMVGACAYFDPLTTDIREEVFSRSAF